MPHAEEGRQPLSEVCRVLPGHGVPAQRHHGHSSAGPPLASALLAITLLDEPFRAALVAGTVLIVAGAAAIAWEGARPVDFKAIGLALALIAAVVFSVRDIVVRWASDETAPSPQVAMAASFATATGS